MGSKSKKGLKNLISAAAQGAGINEGDEYSSNDHVHKKKSSHKNKHLHQQGPQQSNTAPTLEDNIAASIQNSIPPPSDELPFKVSKM